MVANGARPIVLPFRRGPWHGRVREFFPGDTIHPWVLLGPMEIDGEVVRVFGIYELTVVVSPLGEAITCYQFLQIVPEQRIRTGKWSFKVRGERAVKLDADPAEGAI